MFVDDILMQSRSREEHKIHLRITLLTLWENRLHAKLSKCGFWLLEVVFLGHVVLATGAVVDPTKVEAIEMGVIYYSHRDTELSTFHWILQEVYTGFLFTGNPSHMAG